jgi:hypothetical protein
MNWHPRLQQEIYDEIADLGHVYAPSKESCEDIGTSDTGYTFQQPLCFEDFGRFIARSRAWQQIGLYSLFFSPLRNPEYFRGIFLFLFSWS